MESVATSLASSFRFHEQIESPLSFCRREWRALVIFGLGFTVLLVTAVLLVDESFFYARLQTDALLYLLKGKSFADTGTAAARLAINLAPFPYASMPGVFRSPFIWAFRDFDDQLRAIQLANIAILDSVALMSAYIFSWTLPRGKHWMAIAFAFGFTLMTPSWMANVFLALTDAPYAAFSVLSILVATHVLSSRRPLRERPVMAGLFIIVFAIGFLFRFTEPFVLVLVAALVKGRLGDRALGRNARLVAFGLPLVLIGILVLFNFDTIVTRYLLEPFNYAMKGEKQAMFLNLFALAIPEQVVPGFSLGFSHPPMINLYRGEFARTHGDIAMSAIGLIISAIIIWGAWCSRKRILPELMLVVALLPILAVIMPSTPRYLLTYQAFFWIAAYEGLRLLSKKLPDAFAQRLRPGVGVLVGAMLIAGVGFGLASRGLVGAGRRRHSGGSKRVVANYVSGVSDTYRPLKVFLETLPTERTLLTSLRPSLGRWKVIANLDYYAPDSAMESVAARRDVYLVLDCGAVDACAAFPEMERRAEDALCLVGEFTYQLVFEARSTKSRARVYRVRPA